MPLEVGSRLGHFQVTALIGAGGMGQVYRSTNTWMDRTVAIRVRASDPVRVVGCGLVAAALLTGTLRAQQSPIATAESVPRQTIAVMPFANISRAAVDQWIGAGIAETLRVDLQNTPGVDVLDLGTVRQAVQSGTALGGDILDDAAALQIGRERRATWLIAGAYQRVGDHLRITARLLEVATGDVFHTVRVDGTVDELFALQDRVAEAVGTHLQPGNRLPSREASSGAVDLVEQLDRFPLTPTPSAAPGPPASDSVGTSPAVVTAAEVGEVGVLPVVIDGPPPPLPPETVARDSAGRATIRAIRLTAPLRVDGTLDESVYETVPAFSDFIQTEPRPGAPATEKTEVWVLFDRNNLYIAARCWESHPERMVVNEMRRDNVNIIENENFAFMLDTFYDRRNGVLFNLNPIGGRTDGQITNERGYNGDWNPVYTLRLGTFDGGWTAEVALPFKSLRYRPGRAQVWGFNARRLNRWKNESSFVVRMPPARGVGSMIFQISQAATLVGLEVPPGSRNLEVKPYAISDLTIDRTATPTISNDPGADVGVDVKYGITQNLTADITVNTDFAQVEADEQQVNLTRFSLFFPEKREFFLENQGLFAFGGAGTRGGGLTPILFYSRQIGLHQGREVPIDGGSRLTGRVGAFSVGVLSTQTAAAPEAGAVATNFSVVRLKRDVLRRSSIGALFTRRSVSTRGPGSNETYGLDGTFGFFDNLSINTYWAQTRTAGLESDDDSYRAQLNYAGDRYGVQVERLVVGTSFNPEIGFLRRDDFERSFGLFRFSPRLLSVAAIRKLLWEGRVDYVTDRAGVLETREAQGQFGIEFESSDQFNVTYTRNYEFLERPFPIAPDVTIPVGGYNFQDVQASFSVGRQRRFSGTFSVQHGSFFSGEKTTVGFNRGYLELTPRWSLEPSLSFNRIALPEGRFTTQLVTARTTYTVTPLMFVSGLLQYNSRNDSLSTNLRLRWEYSPGSELFVVYNEDRDTDPLLPDRFAELRNRAFIIKVNRLFRF